MAKKQFKSESKRLLDLMVNSIYTHKEIFLREIISNASDAIDKLCYISLTDDKVGLNRDDFKITVTADKENRTITVSDNGIGMTAEELEQNLGVIAKSGSLQFKKDIGDKKEDVDIIGQFGVGFYSAFMVASKVTVVTRAYGQEEANMWVSTGSDGYTITPCEKDSAGTEIIIALKEDEEGESYGEFLEEHELHRIIKKYSDYIRWPIVMDVTKSRQVETDETDKDGSKKKTWEDYTEKEVVNSRVPIWQRSRSEVSDEECMQFYKEKFFDMEDPVSVIRISAEGAVTYKAMLFIPAKAPYDYYTREYKSGLQLYTSGVMIMETCADLLPEHFRFVRGIVDSQDLSLNISREMLQHDRQLKVIETNLEKKIKAELKRLLENDYDKYAAFYKSFGLQLKYGIVNGYGANRDLLSDLIMFYSSKAEKLITLADYVKNMPEDQKYIYYACGESVQKLDKLPQAENVREKGYEILYLTDDVDEFVVKTLIRFEEKEFRSVNDDDLGLETEEEKKETEKLETENKDVLDFIKESLGGKIAAAKLSHKLKSHPVCLTAQGGISLEMERYFAATQGDMAEHMKAERVLELNAGHPVFQALKSTFPTDKEKAAKYAELLYGQAQLIAGVSLDDPAHFAELVSSLMI
ncbi:molecular chaperone HtpG [Sporobacter termitidis DSM 10068]|uniref:Chaperone protein HtpG n=1 Tax=Sporobacter termitidis DSM 10068 TaxID=1123282 RepID=A0A1M5VLY0_9FIRM|nr:molecular chaperone HtpG [Sporobacter termitidis]SHH76249.1 molecular chaperone HtpG [Sporobacter termitidis DSM 10068]